MQMHMMSSNMNVFSCAETCIQVFSHAQVCTMLKLLLAWK